MRALGGRDQAVRVAACLASAIVAGGLILGSVTNSADAADSAPAVTTTTAAATVATRTTTVAPTTTTTVAPTTTTTTAAAAATTVAPVATTNAAAPTTTTPVIEATVETEPAVAESTEPAVAETTPETTVAASTNQSSCRSDLPGAVMTITMADIGYECAVYPGGQSVIDAGVATVITADDSPLALASSPGEAGTLWITGHRTSHGGPFAAVPDLADGAIITVSDGTVVASYVIVGRAYVEVRDGLAVDASGTPTESATLDAVLRSDGNAESAARLLLQTCDSEDFRWMIYADLITG